MNQGNGRPLQGKDRVWGPRGVNPGCEGRGRVPESSMGLQVLVLKLEGGSPYVVRSEYRALVGRRR